MKNRIITFVLISYAISWLIWLPNVLYRQFGIGYYLPWLHFFGGLGPFLGAIITTFIFSKSIGVKKFFQEKYRLPKLKWFLVGIVMPVVIALVAYLSLGIFTNNWIQLSDIGLNVKVPTESALVVWIIWLFFYGFGEEGGWRGLLFPEFTQKYNALTSAIFVSLIWASWHLPLFFYDKDFMSYGMGGTVGWVVGLMFGSVMLAWLAKQSKWILWPVIFWHGTFNLFTAGDRTGYSFAAIVSTLVMVIVVWIVWQYGVNLDKPKKHLLTKKNVPPNSAEPGEPAKAG